MRSLLPHILIGEPVATSPGYALPHIVTCILVGFFRPNKWPHVAAQPKTCCASRATRLFSPSRSRATP
jgi:hypothetical protein